MWEQLRMACRVNCPELLSQRVLVIAPFLITSASSSLVELTRLIPCAQQVVRVQARGKISLSNLVEALSAGYFICEFQGSEGSRML